MENATKTKSSDSKFLWKFILNYEKLYFLILEYIAINIYFFVYFSLGSYRKCNYDPNVKIFSEMSINICSSVDISL